MKQTRQVKRYSPANEIIEVKQVNLSQNFEKKKNLLIESVKQMFFGLKDFVVGLFKVISIIVMFIVTTTYLGYKTFFNYAKNKKGKN